MSTPAAKRSRAAKLLPFTNVAVAQLNMGIVTAGSFVVTPAVLYGLGDSAYGGWLLINAFISYMRLLDLGTSAGTMKYGAGAYERGHAGDLARVFNTSAAVFLSVAGASLILTVALVGALPRLYPTVAADQTGTILMLGAALALDLGFRTFAAALRTRSLFFICDSVEIVTYTIFKLVLVLYFAHSEAGLSYRLLALLTLGETLVRNLLITGAALVLCPFTRKIRPLHAERDMFKKLAAIGAAVSIIQVADILRFQVDAAVIGWFRPESPEQISIFGIGTRLASIAYTSIGVIGSVLMPRFSGLSETGDRDSMTKLLRKASLATGLVSSYALVNLAVLGPNFLMLWLKKPWVVVSGQILLIMLPAYYVALFAGPSAALLFGRGKLRGMTLITVAEGLLNFVLSVILIGPLGIYGVALGTVIPMLIFRGVGFPLLLKIEVGLPPIEYFRLHQRSLGIGVLYFILVGALAFVPLPTYPRFILLGLASTAVFGVLVFVAVPEVRGVIVERLRRKRGVHA